MFAGGGSRGCAERTVGTHRIPDGPVKRGTCAVGVDVWCPWPPEGHGLVDHALSAISARTCAMKSSVPTAPRSPLSLLLTATMVPSSLSFSPRMSM